MGLLRRTLLEALEPLGETGGPVSGSLRADDLAHPRRSESGARGRAARGEVGVLGTRGSPERPKRRSRRSARRWSPSTTSRRRRHPEPRVRLRGGPSREPSSRTGVRGATQGRPPEAGDESSLCHRRLAHVHGCRGRPSPGSPQLRHRRVRPGGCGGDRPGRRRRRRPSVGGPPGEGPGACRLSGDRAGRGDAAPGGSRPGPRHQRGPRGGGHNRHLHRARRPGVRRHPRGSRRRHECRSRGDARGHRPESGVRRPGRPGLRRGPRARLPAHPPRAVSGRDRCEVSVASSCGAPAGELERRPCGLWNGLHRPAPDRSALRRTLGPRAPGRLHRGLRAQGLRDRSRALDGRPGRCGGLREGVEPGAPRRRRGRHRLRGKGRLGDVGRLGRRSGGWSLRRSGDRLPCGPGSLRRALRQPRLAAGAPSALDEADLGQRRPHEPGHRREARRLPNRGDRVGSRE